MNKYTKIYKEIGDIFEYKGVKLQVIEACTTLCKDCTLYLKNTKACTPLDNICNNCYFCEIPNHCDTMLCCNSERTDGKSVIFKKVQ